MTRKIVTYIVVLLIGLFFGYLFFGSSHTSESSQKQITTENIGSWTCSMHPKVQNDSEGKCSLCAMDLVYVSKQNTSLSQSQFEMSEDAIAIANIETITLGSNMGEDAMIKLSGKIVTNEQTDGIQSSLFNGRIEQFYANYIGKKVYKGQKIGIIYSPELYSAQEELLSSLKYRKTHKNLFTEARNADGLWKVSDAEIDSMLANKKPVFNFSLYADVSGTITEIFVKEGEFYKEGQTLFKTSDLRKVWAIYDCYENQLNGLKKGDDVQVLVKGLDQNIIKSKVDFIEPIIDEVKRTVALRVVIDNKDGLIKPGMLTTAMLNIDTSNNTMVKVPKSAVLWTGKRSLVYMKPFKNKPIFEMTEIELGQDIGDYYEVIDGVSNGDVIVAQGAFTVDATAELSGKKSMMSMSTVPTHETKAGKNVMKQELGGNTSKIMISTSSEENFTEILAHYISLKNALIKSDFETTKKNAKAFEKKIKKLLELNKNQAKELQVINQNLNNIVDAKTIEGQRKAFKPLSEKMISITSEIKHLDTKVFVQHCDCADDFTGGSWLSFDDKVLNPYFGDAMLTCGRVKQVFN